MLTAPTDGDDTGIDENGSLVMFVSSFFRYDNALLGEGCGRRLFPLVSQQIWVSGADRQSTLESNNS